MPPSDNAVNECISRCGQSMNVVVRMWFQAPSIELVLHAVASLSHSVSSFLIRQRTPRYMESWLDALEYFY